MKTYVGELIATPQFDSGRWKLRLENKPLSIDRELTTPMFSRIALGFTMTSPLLFFVAAYPLLPSY
jgi:hypothetical protein